MGRKGPETLDHLREDVVMPPRALDRVIGPEPGLLVLID